MSRHVFLHVGDAHLCSAHPRNGDRLAALDQIIARGKTTDGLAAILWPGDLYDQKSTVEDRNALVERVRLMAAIAPVVICYGNHDQPGDLDVLAKLDTTWPVFVVDRPHVLHFKAATRAKVACFVLPYPHKAGLVAAGVEHERLGQDARSLLEPVFIAAAAELAEAAAGGSLPLMLGHVNVGGSLASTGQPQIGRELELDPMLLARLGPIYKGLNHIHRHQEIAGAVYAGSICRMDFGEAEPKGLVVAEYRDREFDRSDFVGLHVPEQYHVHGRLTREAFTIERVDGDTHWNGHWWTGADVKVSYTYKKSEVGVLDVAKIHAEFANCRSLKRDGTPELEREIRAPEVAAAVTVTEKAEACCRTLGLTVTPGLHTKLAALQTAEREAILRWVVSAAAPASQPTPQAELTEVA